MYRCIDAVIEGQCNSTPQQGIQYIRYQAEKYDMKSLNISTVFHYPPSSALPLLPILASHYGPLCELVYTLALTASNNYRKTE